MEIRELRYFVAVAEELHFGRAARRLGIAQPPLSRAIRQLERKIGVELLARTPQRVTLTGAGQVLLADAKHILDAVSAATTRTRRAGSRPEKLVVAMKPSLDGGLLPEILAAYDTLPVEVVIYGMGEQTELVRDGRADLLFVHDQADLSGLDTIEFRREGRVLVVPRTHRLASRTSVCMADLSGETYWPRDQVEFTEASHLLQVVALGRAVALLPETAGHRLRDDLVGIPVPDAEPARVLLAWPEGSRSPALAAFVRVATEIADAARGERSGGGD
ncbi:LysR family transcriptional regulator [Fodinicola acaciae]|uniref:LysR family transcriptional regulator n=1 Tax=Fodinicola acaciae TaxID=2681555 RepID=UPI0013D0FF01|nr:LysR substrate-binding domain-containing protein [Fodinicola acaciae]